MKKEVIGTVTHDHHIWYFDAEEHNFSDDVVSALDELLGECTSVGDKFKITIEKL